MFRNLDSCIQMCFLFHFIFTVSIKNIFSEASNEMMLMSWHKAFIIFLCHESPLVVRSVTILISNWWGLYRIIP